MGRSVSTPADAVGVFYLDWTPEPAEDGHDFYRTKITNNMVCAHCGLVPLDQDDVDSECGPTEMDYEWEWDYLTHDDFVGNVLQSLFPSVERVDEWIGREDRVVAGNAHALFGVSEYCGLAAFWVVVNPRADGDGWWDDRTYRPLAEAWIEKAWPKVEEMYPSRLRKMGTFSNGTSVYERTA